MLQIVVRTCFNIIDFLCLILLIILELNFSKSFALFVIPNFIKVFFLVLFRQYLKFKAIFFTSINLLVKPLYQEFLADDLMFALYSQEFGNRSIVISLLCYLSRESIFTLSIKKFSRKHLSRISQISIILILLTLISRPFPNYFIVLRP